MAVNFCSNFEFLPATMNELVVAEARIRAVLPEGFELVCIECRLQAFPVAILRKGESLQRWQIDGKTVSGWQLGCCEEIRHDPRPGDGDVKEVNDG